jgi:hypothetical protein
MYTANYSTFIKQYEVVISLQIGRAKQTRIKRLFSVITTISLCLDLDLEVSRDIM